MTHTARELDVRPIAPAGRHPAVFGAFDALGPDEAIVLINDHDPSPLLREFQSERRGHFEWSVLEAGPSRFRVEIRRRADEGPRNVSEYLGGDHRRLDALLAEATELAEGEAWDRARALFGEFACGLDRHIDAEEKVLFPRFEELAGTGHGPTRVMRAEHIAIRDLMDQVRAALKDEDAKRSAEWLRALAGDLETHNRKEEGVLYPGVDAAIGDERELDRLVEALQAC